MEDNKQQENQKPQQAPQPKVSKYEAPKEKKPSKIKAKLAQWKRTIEVAKKPDKEELQTSLKITMAGMAIMGGLGFIIFLIYNLVF